MPSLLDVALTLRPAELAPTEGTINLEPIQRISPLLQQADDAVQQAGRTMAGIDRSAVLAPVGDAVLTLWRKLDQAAEVTEPGARIARLLPPMLGASAPRTYLVVFQNPAEPRATGGIFGSFAVATARSPSSSRARRHGRWVSSTRRPLVSPRRNRTCTARRWPVFRRM
jgi:hypothetical protein